ncbi:MAG: NTP transferase domain-containing protein [Candidatus Anammoximicrobium sp.]|nr:NTP transferase domain-containing protein [Candidatus Anammoximicrobium sp.]
MPATNLDKAVILARGLGTRMRAADDTAALDERQAVAAASGVKALIPLGDRPFLDYLLATLADAGYRRICLVVGPEQEEIRDYYTRRVTLQRLSIRFAIQDQALGTADAVAAAAAFAGDDPFLTVNSDNFYPREACQALRNLSGPGLVLFERDAMLARSNIAADRVSKFAVGDVDDEGCLRRIVEKPDAETLAQMPKPLWLSMNCWRFGPAIFRACRSIPRSPRGEYEIVAAVQYAIDVLGERFHAIRMQAPVLDLTSRGDIGPVAARLVGMEIRL